ncbi:FixH family protein [bacterium]|nr:FixH family protein [bacterium]
MIRWHFAPTVWTTVFGLVALGLTVWLSQAGWRRARGGRASTTLRSGLLALELLRVTIVALVVFTLAKPELVRLVRPHNQPALVVLSDGSRSMTTRDVVLEDGRRVVGRDDWVRQQRDAAPWGAMSNRFRIVVEDFSRPTPEEREPAGGTTNSSTSGSGKGEEEGTDINTALAEVSAREPNLQAVLLLSDGDWNLGESPVMAATRLAARHVPVFSVGVGSREFLPDLVLESVSAPAYGLLGEQVFVGFTLRSHLDREVRTVVRLQDGQGPELAKEVVIPAHGQVQDALFWVPATEGKVNLRLVVAAEPDELRTDNNEQRFTVVVRKEILRVLVVDSLPRWEYRFLRNALQRDPGVQVDTVLWHPGMASGEGRGYLPAFPSGKDRLSAYDVVFLGDVGVGDGQLTETDATDLRGLVEQQGSGLVFLPGPLGRQQSLWSGPLGDLLPVELDDTKPQGMVSTAPLPLALTVRGRGHLLTMLASSEDQNARIWGSLPGFTWYAPVRKARPGADVLAVHDTARTEWGRIPLLVTRVWGAGQVLFMGTDAAWRWRRGVEDVYHYRFWGQVVRWMAYRRHLATERGLRVFYQPDNPRRGETVIVRATVLEALSGQPVSGAAVRAEVTAPSGRAERLELQPTAGGWGVYQGELVPRERGAYTLQVQTQPSGRLVETVMQVRGLQREQVGRPAPLEVLEEIARITHGETGSPDDLPRFLGRLESLPPPAPQEQRWRLWCHPGWGALIVALLAAYWIGRKIMGMV